MISGGLKAGVSPSSHQDITTAALEFAQSAQKKPAPMTVLVLCF
jgi:hypothetical protein